MHFFCQFLPESYGSGFLGYNHEREVAAVLRKIRCCGAAAAVEKGRCRTGPDECRPGLSCWNKKASSVFFVCRRGKRFGQRAAKQRFKGSVHIIWKNL